MLIKCALVILTLAVPTRASSGLNDTLIPEPMKMLNQDLTQSPIARVISDLTGDTIAIWPNIWPRPVIDLRLAISRLIGSGGQFPKLLDHNIDSDFQENFLEQFNAGRHNEDAHLQITELVTKYGYAINEHNVQTSDGYILTLYRIPPVKDTGNKSAVLLMHGLFGSSDDWVISGPEHGLAYILASRGYDVWLGNARGNTHSKRHTSLSPTLSPAKFKFWDFSWNEIGRYDLPAIIDYILATTGRSRLKYVGHSQGTTAFFVMCSELPEYNEKIEVMAALSPVAWMTNVVSPVVRMMAASGTSIHGVLNNIGVNEFLPNHTIMKTLGELLCAENALSEIFCANVLFLTCGFSIEQLNATTLPIILGHLPAGASVKQLAHYGQGLLSRDFRKFDGGPGGNFESYGIETPPSYNVSQITAPIALFYSENDWLASPEDVRELQGKLPNVVDAHLIPRKQFNHIDFLWGVDAKELVFAKLLQIMENF